MVRWRPSHTMGIRSQRLFTVIKGDYWALAEPCALLSAILVNIEKLYCAIRMVATYN